MIPETTPGDPLWTPCPACRDQGKPEFAAACRAILLRFAECYPNWLVHVGYGEHADMDPRAASLGINNLPEEELCPPPNTPDRRSHTGYWSAGRAGGVGMESGFVRQMVEAYDFTCAATDAGGAPITGHFAAASVQDQKLVRTFVEPDPTSAAATPGGEGTSGGD